MALHVTHRFDVDSPISRGAAIRAIRPPQGVMGSNPRSSRRPHPMVKAVRALRALQEVQYHFKCNACWPARRRKACGLHKLLSDFTVAGVLEKPVASDV